MKKKLFTCLLAGLMTMMMTVPVLGDTIDGGSDYKVTFTKGNHLELNYSDDDLNRTITALQPGDSVVYKFTLVNSNKADAQFYMSNAIIKEFEESNASAAGGAYGYELIYTNPEGEETVLYSSDTVGGEGDLGLKDATTSLNEYVYLDTLSTKENGALSLTISLDGETEGNSYQSAVASMTMSFAVEKGALDDPQPEPDPDTEDPEDPDTEDPEDPDTEEPEDPVTPAPSDPTPTDPTHPIKTGDYSYMYLYAGIALGAGLILFAIAFLRLKKDRNEEEGDA